MNRIESIEAFVSVVDHRGFGSAADHLGIAKSILSRRVSDLEKRLGVQLLQRTTRRQSLTEAGDEFYQRAVQILADLAEAEESIGNAECQISGRIKLALPLVLGSSQMAVPIHRFLCDHPRIKIDVDLNDRAQDLIANNIDLAIRIGHLEDSSLIVRRLGEVDFAICASPEYLKRYGEPTSPAELSRHQVLVYSNVSAGRQWALNQRKQRGSPRLQYRLRANNGEFLAAVASRGQAMVNGPRAYLQSYLDDGSLVPILQAHTPPPAPMYAVYPPGRQVSRRVRLLSDAFYQYFRENCDTSAEHPAQEAPD